jgi:thiol-disulfide isomerase/thioredoxin
MKTKWFFLPGVGLSDNAPQKTHITRLLRPVLFAFYILLCSCVIGQQRFSVTLHLPTQLDVKKLTVFCNNGTVEKEMIPYSINTNTLVLTDSFHAKYAAINLRYRKNEHENYTSTFFVKEKPADITLVYKSDSKDLLKDYVLKNAYDFKDEKQKIGDYTKDETKSIDLFMATIEDNTNPWADSLILAQFNEKYSLLRKKELEFICLNGQSYYSFFLFRRNYANARLDANEADSLLHLFNNVFPENFKTSEEGVTAKQLLEGQKLKIGGTAPLFAAKDMFGKKVSSENFLGKKHILLVFWATWCSPCMAEVPEIKRLSEKYRDKELELVFVSYDKDYAQFSKVVKEKEMCWTNIFNDVNMINSFGGYQPIPRVYLIDKSGKIIYNGKEMYDGNLSRLDEMLSHIN